MTRKKPRSRCLVIDASVGHAAGSPHSGHQIGSRTRDFLLAVRAGSHRMAWSAFIKSEWEIHQSQFASQWLVSMTRLRKLQLVNDELNEELRNAIQESSRDRNVITIMLKDAPLVEAALKTDNRLASLDETARGHFRRLAVELQSIRVIIWVNPTIEEEQAVDWIENGAPAGRKWRLKR